MARIKDRVSVG